MTSATMTTSEQAKATLAAKGVTIDPAAFAAGVEKRATGYIARTQNVDTNRLSVADALCEAKDMLTHAEKEFLADPTSTRKAAMYLQTEAVVVNLQAR